MIISLFAILRMNGKKLTYLALISLNSVIRTKTLKIMVKWTLPALDLAPVSSEPYNRKVKTYDEIVFVGVSTC